MRAGSICGCGCRTRRKPWRRSCAAASSAHVKRGAVHIALKLKAETQGAAQAPDLDALHQAAAAVALARTALEAQGVPVAPTDPATLLTLPGVATDGDAAPLPNAQILAGFDRAIAGFADMRSREGTALAEITTGQLDALGALVTDAKARLAERQAQQTEPLPRPGGRACRGRRPGA